MPVPSADPGDPSNPPPRHSPASLVATTLRNGGNSPPDLAADLLSAPPPGDHDAPREWFELEGWVRPHPCGKWTWRNADTGEIRPFRCGSWKCPGCAYKKARSWLRLIAFAPVQRHLVFTRLPGDPQLTSARLRAIVKAIRRGEGVELRRGRRHPRRFEYLATAEKHNRAGVHVHLLQHGDFVSQRILSQMLPRYGAGRVNWAERIDDAGTPALARYVTRHLIKFEHPYQPKQGRRLRYSRRFWDPAGEIGPPQLRRALAGDPQPGWQLLRTEAFNATPQA